MGKEEKLNRTLSELETNRLAFIVYRRALVYTGAVIAFIVTVLGFWGYNDWKDLKSNIETLEKKASKADSIVSANISNFERLDEERKELLQVWKENLINMGKLEQLEKTLEEKVSEKLKENERKLNFVIEATDVNFLEEQEKLRDNQASLKEQIAELQILKRDIRNYLDSLKTTGATVLLLQANKTTPFKEFNFSITLGNVENESVEYIEILFDHNREKLGTESIKMGEEYLFHCTGCEKEGQPARQYVFTPVARLAQPIVHDLLVAKLRWRVEFFKDGK